MLRCVLVLRAGSGDGRGAGSAWGPPLLKQGFLNSSQGPRGMCVCVHACTVQGRSRFPRCVWPQAGRSPCPLLGVGPGSEKGHPAQVLSLLAEYKCSLMPCAMRTATALLGSLLWLEMVRPERPGLGVGEGPEPGGSWHYPCPLPCRSETGRCLRSGERQKGTCEIFAWCPVETRSRPT